MSDEKRPPVDTDLDIHTTKYCRRCETHKNITEFGKARHRPDGHKDWCRPCWNSYHQARDFYVPESIIQSTQKKCTVCCEIKPLAQFNTDKRHLDGHASRCAACHSRINSERQRKLAEDEEVRAKWRKQRQDWRDANPEKQAAITARKKVKIMRERGQEPPEDLLAIAFPPGWKPRVGRTPDEEKELRAQIQADRRAADPEKSRAYHRAYMRAYSQRPEVIERRRAADQRRKAARAAAAALENNTTTLPPENHP